MVDVISRYEGTIDEIIGDAILVIFGAPLLYEVGGIGDPFNLSLPAISAASFRFIDGGSKAARSLPTTGRPFT